MNESNSFLQRTALFDSHRALGAKLVPFAGWEMPVQYSNVSAEAIVVREGCGIFDVSHMGQLDVRGPNVTEELNRIVSADWSDVSVGRAAYSLLLNEQAGVHDDIMGYRLGEEHWLVVANASRAQADEEYLRAHLPAEISLQNRYENQAMIAIQGPQSEEILKTICPDATTIAWREAKEIAGFGVVARGGYTGSDGFEWMWQAEDAAPLWNALLEAGATPCGLGARDILRLEAALPLYGHELRADWTPEVSGCAWAVKKTGDFIGRAAWEERTPATQRIRGLEMLGRALAREEYEIQKDSETVGVVTSGTLSPSRGCGIALALLPTEIPIGETVDVIIRGAAHPARVVKPPFVPHARHKKTSKETQ